MKKIIFVYKVILKFYIRIRTDFIYYEKIRNNSKKHGTRLSDIATLLLKIIELQNKILQ